MEWQGPLILCGGDCMKDLSRPLRALVADDSLLTSAIVEYILKDWGYAVETAGTGLAAFLTVQNQEFDLIVMDLEMPEMSGLEAATAIRRLKGERYRQLLIVGMIAHREPTYLEICLKHGMNALMFKPIQAGELLTELQNLEHSFAATLQAVEARVGGLDCPSGS
jgi:CheY-like chemotaxis protein